MSAMSSSSPTLNNSASFLLETYIIGFTFQYVLKTDMLRVKQMLKNNCQQTARTVSSCLWLTISSTGITTFFSGHECGKYFSMPENFNHKGLFNHTPEGNEKLLSPLIHPRSVIYSSHSLGCTWWKTHHQWLHHFKVKESLPFLPPLCSSRDSRIYTRSPQTWPVLCVSARRTC